MNQRQLEIFTTLAQNLNFTKTADQLYLSQTTVTLQIRNLEEELHVKLFDRTSRSVNLTYAGSVFLEGAIRIQHLMKETIDQTVAAARGYTSQLKIGFADDVNATGIAKLLFHFSKTHPSVRLIISGGYPDDLLNSLMTGDFDLIFTPSYLGIKSDKLPHKVIGSFHTVAAFHKSHRFSKRRSLHFSDFADENFIHISGSSRELSFTAEFLHQLEQRDIPIHTLSRTDNIDTVFLMLDANLGITVLPEYFKGRFSGNSEIKTCPIQESLAPTNFLAVWKPGKQDVGLELFLKDAIRTQETGR